MSFHVRRKDKEIIDIEALKRILKSTKYVTIAMCMDGQPYLVSLSHGYDEKRNCIYFHCAMEGKKLVYLRANNTVWGQSMLDYGYAEGGCEHIYASVHFQGKVTLLTNLDEKRSAVECMIRQLDKNPERLLAKLSNERLEKAAVGKIAVTYMSGKKSKQVTL